MKRKWLVTTIAVLVLAGMIFSVSALAAEENTSTFKEGRFRLIGPRGQKWKIFRVQGRSVPILRKMEQILPKLILMFRRGISQLLSKLQLTSEQQEDLKKLQLNFQEEILELRMELEKRQLQLKRLLLEDPADLTKIEALVDEMTPFQTEIKKKTIRFWIEVKDIFTEEQLAKFNRWNSAFRFGGGRMMLKGPYHFMGR
ncbi:periplasmic heavy metal sensor [Candidatus Aerophobetes bacterium]|uniref:Periplasmic heavy metal sensor n=1 Tax=Aerophobetes bacterium TaxID=2030807 RepID=A0A523S460_UNCAE|nr:MAG: periplasmic heavy metal sensor [Candidatus Aerophobetes bacterium]